MSVDGHWETTDVVICGCGPTGALLSAYLGRMGVHNIVLEREPEITTDPRGIALDDDGIRFLQGLGLYDSVYTKIGTSMGRFNFVGGTTCDLHTKPILEMDYNTTTGATGHVGFIGHKQPVLESQIRSAMSPSFCSLRCNSTVTQLEEDEEWTYCTYCDADGEHKIRALFFVGADGKTGYTRKQYLEPRGVMLEKFHEAFYEDTWVALNWRITIPTPRSHPSFPLWKEGYSPEQVYDLFFPPEFRFLCNPYRPAVCGRFGLPTDRLWRFEYLIQKDEDGHAMAKPEAMRSIVYPYLTHRGSRYNLVEDVQFPEDCIEVLRCRPFSFSSRICNIWVKGRVILCGDAAHVFPPFGGQGIASGFRDAISLSWRLAMLCRYQPRKENHHDVLKAWYKERKQQLALSLATTVENGRMVCETHPLKIFIRDWYIWLIQLIPSWRRQLQHGRRKDAIVRYKHSDGMPFIPDLNGGLYLPQVYCRTMKGEILFTDDAIYSPDSKSLFRLFVYLQDTSDLSSINDTLQDIESWSRGEFNPIHIPIIVENITTDLSKPSNIFQIATAEEFSTSPHCNNRPKPLDHDPLLLRNNIQGKYVIVRMDRFIYASCTDEKELRRAVKSMLGYLDGEIRESR
ncbi:putative monooxygenase [Aspergillus ibericus CBS 121593]|uniref:Monooxygenase n=1 Tax=Aspergillus ibericus CBS 121593 TaxID=1448316 RepID=A0A395GX97_9EURO|nr:monooxygenase [Aspergillus ibericus CBS 121593]RAL00156.1 monooxygenase [Aspergillus ibericus CBS 121593]